MEMLDIERITGCLHDYIYILEKESRYQGRENVLSALFRVRFGEAADTKKFSVWMSFWEDQESAVKAILAVDDPAELLAEKYRPQECRPNRSIDGEDVDDKAAGDGG